MNGTKNNPNGVDFNIPNKLLYNLHSQRRNGEFCDVRFCIADTVCSVHSCVLASFSPYLQHIFAHTLSRNKTNFVGSSEEVTNMNLKMWSMKNPIQIHVICKDTCSSSLCPECLLKVIDFMYVGKIHIQKEHLNHIQQLGKILEISELLLICDKFLKKNKGKVMKSLGLGRTVDAVVKIYLQVKLSSEDFHESKECRNVSVNAVTEQLQIDSSNSPANVIDNNKEYEQINGCEKTSTIIRTSNINLKKVKQASDSDPYICSKCSIHFANMSLLRQHHQQAHCGRLYTCYTCRFSARKAYSLFKHLQKANHNESVCSLCMFEASSAEELKVHIQQHNHPKPFFCDVCNARFPTRASANSHYPTHSTEAPYSCEVCEKSFKWKHGLQNHMVVHGTEKKHLCAQCGFSTRHLRSFHTHELLHTSPLLKCPSPGCAFQTRVKKYLSSHLLTHNKEKPYQCEICGCSFSQAKNLHRHAEKHDSTTFVEKCHLCLYQTTRVDKLVTHFKKHHPEGDLQELVALRKKRKMEYLRNKASSARSLGSKSNKNSSLKSVTPASTDVVQAESVKGGVVSMECGDVSSSLILQPETQCQDIIIVTTGGLLLDYESMNYAESDAIRHLQDTYTSEDAVVVGGNHEGEISFVPVGEQDSVLLQPTDDTENLCLAIPPQPSNGQAVDGCILEEILDPGVTAVTAGDQLQSDGLRHVEGLSLAEDTNACVTLPGVISAQYEQLLENLERGSVKADATSTSELLSASVLDASEAVPFSPQDVEIDMTESESNFFSDLSHIVSDKTLVDIVDDSSFVAADVGLLSSNPDDVHLDADSSIFNSLHELSWFQ